MAQPFDPLKDWKETHKMLQNYWAALHELNLTPQEQHIYNHHLSNMSRGGVPSPDGVQTFRSFTSTFDNGKTYILPHVWDNQVLSTPEAIQRAKAEGLDKWPSYNTVDEAEKRYKDIHRYIARDPSAYANPIGQSSRVNNP